MIRNRRRAGRCAVFGLAAVASAVRTTAALAWYFPEHTEFTRLALHDFAPSYATTAIQHVVADAQRDGLDLCPEATTALHAIPRSPPCVPYGALAAIAADHSNTVVDLRANLSVPLSRPWPVTNETLGALLTEAAANTWASFQDSAPPEVVRVWNPSRPSQGISRLPSTLSPRDYVRSLDAELNAIDGLYISRAKNAKTHFHDPTTAIEDTLEQAKSGDLDNALAQALAHHARSLQLAYRSRIAVEPDSEVRRARRTEALLEHAFALHFLEDGLAAGHIVTDPAVAAEERRAQRHDYFNRQGLAVTRSLAKQRCGRTKNAPPWKTTGLDLCWVAHGDGFAGAEDRLYVTEAVARLQTAFALALEPIDPMKYEEILSSPACRSWLAGGEPRRGCDAAWTTLLLDPVPALSADEHTAEDRGAGSPENGSEYRRSWAKAVLVRFEVAIAKLGTMAPLRPADAGSARSQPGTLTSEVVGSPLEPLMRDPKEPEVPSDAADPDVGSTLWLPLLAAWPDSQADATTLEGTDSFGRGINVQVLASFAASYADPFGDRSSVTAWGGVGAGISYSAQGVFPHRHSRAVAELNAGLAQGVTLVGVDQRFPSLLVLEARLPLTTALLYGAASIWKTRMPLAVLGKSVTVGIFGGRAYFYLDSNDARFTGWDVEVVNFPLDASAAPLAASSTGVLDSEGRFRIGWRAADRSETLGSAFGGVFVVSFEVNGGLFHRIF